MDPFDLKFTPDWMKEESPKARYANFEGEEERERRPRSERKRRDKPRGNDDRRPRDERPRRPDRERRAPRDEPRPAEVKVEFLPEPAATEMIIRQIRASGRTYPVIEVARMFLDRPERYLVRVSAGKPEVILHRCGEDGPVATDRATVERQAFDYLGGRYYATETVEGDPPKGNYTNVARCRTTGTLIAPTNHHSYQLALHRLYEERFSRRMSFADFQKQIEVVRDPEAIEAWKQQSRTSTIWRTLEEPPETFTSEQDARAHFARTHLAGLVTNGDSYVLGGELSRSLADPALNTAIRLAYQRERPFPAGVAHHLRIAFLQAHLHIFKLGDRRQFVAAARPHPIPESGLAENAASILRDVRANPECTRKELADRLLAGAEDVEKARTGLAADLHWLIGAGHLIEMHDGKLLLPKEKSAPSSSEAPGEPDAGDKANPPPAA